jgi:hypothetical protein
LSPPLEQDFVPVVVVPVVASPEPVVVVEAEVVPLVLEQQEEVFPSVVAVLLQQDLPLAGSVVVVAVWAVVLIEKANIATAINDIVFFMIFCFNMFFNTYTKHKSKESILNELLIYSYFFKKKVIVSDATFFKSIVYNVKLKQKNNEITTYY